MKLTTHDRAWYERRLDGFGASEAGPLLGVSPWKTARDVVRDKALRIIPDPDAKERLRLRLGRDMEPILLEHLYEQLVERHGSSPRPRTSSVLWRNPTFPFVTANVDGFIGDAMVELKTDEFDAGEWGPEDGDPARAMRPTYWLQVLHGLAATRKPRALVFVQIGFGRQALYEVARPDDQIDALIEVEAGMWARVEAIRERLANDELAPIDDLLPALEGDALTAHLKKTFPRHDELIRSALPDQEELVLRLRSAKVNVAVAEQEEAAATALVQDIIRDAAGLTSQYGTITWRQSKDRVDVGHELIAAAYLSLLRECRDRLAETDNPELLSRLTDERLDAIRTLYTSTKPGARVFLTPRAWTK